jgi:hypothetical protein
LSPTFKGSDLQEIIVPRWRRCKRDRERSEHNSYYNGTYRQHEKGTQTHHLRNRKYIKDITCLTKDTGDGKSRKTELETLVASTKKQLEGVTDKTSQGQATPPSALRRELPRIKRRAVAPSGAGQAKFLAGTEQPKLYSEALGGNSNRNATNSVTSKKATHRTRLKIY